jgi:hypothetical protein
MYEPDRPILPFKFTFAFISLGLTLSITSLHFNIMSSLHRYIIYHVLNEVKGLPVVH